MKKIQWIMISLVAVIIVAGGIPFLISAADESNLTNYTRWNYIINECVYFHSTDDGRAQCFVDEKYCIKDGKNVYRTIPNSKTECYYVPRSEQKKTTTECQQFYEGDKIKLEYEGKDPDSDVGPAGKLIYKVGEPFTDNNEWQTKKGDAGRYNVEVSVSDGEYTDTAHICIDILPSNHPPKLSGVNDLIIKEGETLSLDNIKCEDEDGDEVTLVFKGFTDSIKKSIGYDDAGEYDEDVSCTDPDGEKDSASFKITVEDVNRKPKLSIGTKDISVYEGDTVKISAECIDPEGEKTILSYSGDMTSDTWKTGYEDSGNYDVTVTCTDASDNSVSDNVSVEVINKNRPPVITAVVKKE